MEGTYRNLQKIDIITESEIQELETNSQEEGDTETDVPTASKSRVGRRKQADDDPHHHHDYPHHSHVEGEADLSPSNEAVISQSEKENYEQETSPFPLPDDVCPRINCTEKILFCLDISKEMIETPFRSRVGENMSALNATKKAMKIYIMNKNKINPKHEFGLAVFHDNAMLFTDFTSEPTEIINVFEQLEAEELESGEPSEQFDMSGLLTFIHNTVQVPRVVGEVHLVPPPYIIRVIFIYGRSRCIPVFSNKQLHLELWQSPYFFVDVLYVHEPPSGENKCEDIFTNLCELDHKGLSYILSASSLTRLFDSFAQLLSHPLQRPLQRQASYHMSLSQPTEEQAS